MKRAFIFLILFGVIACSRISPVSPSFPAQSTSGETELFVGSPSANTPLAPQPTNSPSPIPSNTPSSEILLVTVFPDLTNFRWVKFADGLESPIDLTYAGDGSLRVFIVEQKGVIKVFQGNGEQVNTYLDIRDRVGSKGSEQGLLGLAFHPNFSQNGNFYVNYTDKNGDTIVARFSQAPDDADRGDASSEKVLVRVPQPYPNHNGGGLAFGVDGYLYIGLGDGGSAGDPLGNAQSLQTLLGKILRVDVNDDESYKIPADNPFIQGEGLPEIWAYGLRNPWRFAFDPMNGDLYIGDVGQNKWEEIDYWASGSAGGLNFGWNYFEGTHPYQGQPPEQELLAPPVYEYGHDQGCSVTGGVVYRGQALPEWNGIYLFGDYCGGFVRGLLRGSNGEWQVAEMFETGARISSFGVDESGEVYLVDHGGIVYRLERVQ